MPPTVRDIARRRLARFGYEIRRTNNDKFDAQTAATIAAVQPYTMTSPERIAAVCDAVRHVTRWQIPGAIVECGVWAGGSMIAAARTLLELGDTERDLYLFDTFEGMSEPSEADRDQRGTAAAGLLAMSDKRAPVWCYASLQDVRRNVATSGYPTDRIHFVKGMVEQTLPDEAPDGIAVLRLDTDWYESTRHELEHLVRRMTPNGILLIDDYGHWQGARKAVDEWLEASHRPVYLSRVDYTGRVAVISNPTG